MNKFPKLELAHCLSICEVVNIRDFLSKRIRRHASSCPFSVASRISNQVLSHSAHMAKSSSAAETGRFYHDNLQTNNLFVIKVVVSTVMSGSLFARFPIVDYVNTAVAFFL